MTTIAVVFLTLSILVVWGGLAVSALFLRARPEVASYPADDVDDHRQDAGIIEHDT
ncbi:methionine/alanine import family NSS transporter small subunit [Microbacterium koreense]|uniref:Methionine/alanine import family NSS transporter small subunit n=1 Tax=Microbacterium koreense TaxID=323761 RepID=A0ABW2ZQX7_9MICO